MVAQCTRCGRRLKTQPWANMGVGSTCAGRLGISPPLTPKAEKTPKQLTLNQMKSLKPPKQSKIKGFFDVKLRRNPDGTANANVPHAIVRHSPTGFEWGYGGSGPAELALNILSSMIGQEAAEKNGLYQEFKFEFLANLPYDGGTIKVADIQKWFEENKE